MTALITSMRVASLVLATQSRAFTRCPRPTLPRKRGRSAARRHVAQTDPHAGIGNTGFAEANAAGKITWMSLPWICVFTGAAPWFCPLTNLVGP